MEEEEQIMDGKARKEQGDKNGKDEERKVRESSDCGGRASATQLYYSKFFEGCWVKAEGFEAEEFPVFRRFLEKRISPLCAVVLYERPDRRLWLRREVKTGSGHEEGFVNLREEHYVGEELREFAEELPFADCLLKNQWEDGMRGASLHKSQTCYSRAAASDNSFWRGGGDLRDREQDLLCARREQGRQAGTGRQMDASLSQQGPSSPYVRLPSSSPFTNPLRSFRTATNTDIFPPAENAYTAYCLSNPRGLTATTITGTSRAFNTLTSPSCVINGTVVSSDFNSSSNNNSSSSTNYSAYEQELKARVSCDNALRYLTPQAVIEPLRRHYLCFRSAYSANRAVSHSGCLFGGRILLLDACPLCCLPTITHFPALTSPPWRRDGRWRRRAECRWIGRENFDALEEGRRSDGDNNCVAEAGHERKTRMEKEGYIIYDLAYCCRSALGCNKLTTSTLSSALLSRGGRSSKWGKDEYKKRQSETKGQREEIDDTNQESQGNAHQQKDGIQSFGLRACLPVGLYEWDFDDAKKATCSWLCYPYVTAVQPQAYSDHQKFLDWIAFHAFIYALKILRFLF